MAQDFQIRRIVVQPVITGGAYTTADAVGGRLEFDNAATHGIGGKFGAILESVVITDLADQGASVSLDLVLFTEAFTATADNDAFDLADGEDTIVLAVIKVSDYSSFNDNGVYTKTGIGLPIKLTGGDGKLYGQLIARGAPTYASTSDLTVTLGIVRG